MTVVVAVLVLVVLVALVALLVARGGWGGTWAGSRRADDRRRCHGGPEDGSPPSIGGTLGLGS